MFNSPYATKLTREGVLNLHNRKPFRNAAQKKVARRLAVQNKKGYFTSSAPRQLHPAPK